MASAKINREILAALMESPFYFDIPLGQRLAFIKFYSRKYVYHSIRAYNEQLVKGQGYRGLRNMMKAN